MKKNFRILFRSTDIKKSLLAVFALTVIGAGVYSLYAKGPIVKMSEKEARLQKLTPLQRQVTQEEATEPPFQNEYWNEKREGLYVDIVSGKVLFSSKDKYDSGCGWPSFTKPVDSAPVETKKDLKLFMPREEVHSKDGTHLGHIFEDGPKDKGGLRYCINSASLRFIPKEDLDKEGLGEYKKLFEDKK